MYKSKANHMNRTDEFWRFARQSIALENLRLHKPLVDYSSRVHSGTSGLQRREIWTRHMRPHCEFNNRQPPRSELWLSQEDNAH